MTTITSKFNRIAVLTGLALGAFAISAFAVNFSGPKQAPPGCTSGDPGCDAPLNVGPILQTKLGWIALKGLITNDITFSNGTPTPNASVLMAKDANGTIGWGIPGGGSSVNSLVLYDSPVIIKSCSDFYGKCGVIGGTIQAGVTPGISTAAKAVLLYGHVNFAVDGGSYVKFKYPSQSVWKNLFYYAKDDFFATGNSVLIPLDSNGKLSWQTNNAAILEVQGEQD